MTEWTTVGARDGHDLARRLRPFHGDCETARLRAEVIEGRITITNPPCRRHAVIVEEIRRMLIGGLADGEGCFEDTTLEEPRGDRYLPDLAVWPAELVRAGNVAVLRGERCVLAVEVTSARQATRDFQKRAGYARAGVPLYLLVDRTRHECLVHTKPAGGRYATVRAEPFGNLVMLPLDTPVTLDTSRFATC